MPVTVLIFASCTPHTCIPRCLFIVKIQGNKFGGSTPNGFSGSGKCSAVVTSLPFDPKIRLRDKDRLSKSYSRWRPSNKHLYADQFSSVSLYLKVYWSYSTTSTVREKILDEDLMVIWGGRVGGGGDYNQHHPLGSDFGRRLW